MRARQPPWAFYAEFPVRANATTGAGSLSLSRNGSSGAITTDDASRSLCATSRSLMRLVGR